MKLNKREQVFWLHSPKYGQRIVDRRWPINQEPRSRGEEVWVVNPEKWTVALARFEDIRKVYGFEIGKSEPLLQAQYAERIVELHSQAKISAHERHLLKQGISVPTPSVMQRSGRPKAIGCWCCSGSLDSDDHMACVVCKWFLCDCGACGCGFTSK